MEKAKEMWNKLSKNGKIFAIGVAVIIAIVIINAII